MNPVQLNDFQENFEQVLDSVLLNGQLAKILRETGNTTLIPEEIWRGMTATLNLVSIPDMRESIRFGMRENVADLAAGLDW